MNYHEVKLISRDLRKNQTSCEKRLWEYIRDRKLDGYKFLRQHPIVYDRKGNSLNVFIPDFYCPQARLAIEIDGGIHKLTQDHDQWREEILTSMKIKVVRFQNRQLDDIAQVLAEIKTHLVPTPNPSLPAGRGRGG